MKKYQFVGGTLGENGRMFDKEYVMELHETYGRGFSEDYSEIRRMGGTVRREELDNEPMFVGYYGPMWDGERYIVRGEVKHSWECSDEEKESCEKFFVLRYETQDVYDALSE